MLLLDDREVMLSRLTDQHLRTIAVLESDRENNFRKYRIQHPFLGSLHYYDWFRRLAAHDTRHANQLREIVKMYKIS
ncbi:MAG: hypothetical protein LAN18_05595 [Acidobacteriia bacterium]|nr:hypothetical protein [Terriglobia bacterium]